MDENGNFKKVRGTTATVDVWKVGLKGLRGKNGLQEWTDKRSKTVSTEDIWAEEEMSDDEDVPNTSSERPDLTGDGSLAQLPAGNEGESAFEFRVPDEEIDEFMMSDDLDIMGRMAHFVL